MNLILAKEGTNSRNGRILKAESNISKAFWEGDRRNWTLADYCSNHVNSQAELETLGIVRDGASQVQALLSGLRTDQIRQISTVIMNDNGCNTDLQASVIKLLNLWNMLRPPSQANNNVGRHNQCGHYTDRNITSSTSRDNLPDLEVATAEVMLVTRLDSLAVVVTLIQ